MAASKDFLKKRKGYSEDNYGIIRNVIETKFGEYKQESEKSNTVFVIPDISANMIYGIIADALASSHIYSDIIDLHVAVLDYEGGTLIRLSDRDA